MFFNNTDTQRMMLEQQLRLMREGVAMEDIAKSHPDQQKDGVDRFVEGVERFAAGFAQGAAEGWRKAKQKEQSCEPHWIHEDDVYYFEPPPKSHETWRSGWESLWGDHDEYLRTR